MKSIFKLFPLFLVVCLLAGCSAGDTTGDPLHYELLVEDGQYYLRFSAKDPYRNPSVNEYNIAELKFESMAEFVYDVRNNNFTEDEIRIIRNFSKDKEGRIRICDLSDLYEPITPSDLNTPTVSWTGRYYGFMYNRQGIYNARCVTYPLTESEFSDELESISSYPDNAAGTIFAVDYDEERNATVYREGIEGRVRQVAISTITTDTKTLYVAECQVPFEDSPVEDYNIEICGIDNGHYFYAFITDLTARPPVEWIASFGIKEYVETSTQ